MCQTKIDNEKKVKVKLLSSFFVTILRHVGVDNKHYFLTYLAQFVNRHSSAIMPHHYQCHRLTAITAPHGSPESVNAFQWNSVYFTQQINVILSKPPGIPVQKVKNPRLGLLHKFPKITVIKVYTIYSLFYVRQLC